LSWQSIFWINVPIGILGLLLSWQLIPSSTAERPPAPDLRGMALVGLALGALMLGVETVARDVLPHGMPELFIALGMLFSWLTVRHCRRVANPAIQFDLLKIPTFHASTVAGSLFRAGSGALPFLVALTLQVGFGFSATASGFVSLAGALGSFCMRPMTAYALSWFSVRTILIIGSLSFSSILLICACFSASWPISIIFIVLLIGGLSRSLSFASMGALAFADVPPDMLSGATSFQGTAQQLMKAVGVAIAAGSIQATMLLSGRLSATHFDFVCGFIVTALVVLASWPMFAALPSTAGAGISQAKMRRQ